MARARGVDPMTAPGIRITNLPGIFLPRTFSEHTRLNWLVAMELHFSGPY